MKTPKQYLGSYCNDKLESILKQAQLDAIEETVKLCAHKATVDFYTDDDWERVYFVDKGSILHCAEILKKRL